MRIELLWFDGCPNHEAARAALERILASRGIGAAAVRSVEVDEGSVEALKFPGSPTNRVDGRDIEPDFEEPANYALSCRVYQTPKGLRGMPETAWMERAIDDSLLGESAADSPR